MILILGAMQEEIQAFLEKADHIETIQWKEFTEYKAELFGKVVVIAKTGVGKVMSALYSQHLICEYHPEKIIFTGLAGGLSEDLKIGDAIAAVDCVQHDLDATEFGFEYGKIPYTDYHYLKSDQQLLNNVLSFSPDGYTLHKGRIMTGDQFISGKNRSRYLDSFSRLKGDAVEMEGASVALVAAVNKIPFLLVRIISDLADGSAPQNFKAFLNTASHKSLEIVSYLLKKL